MSVLIIRLKDNNITQVVIAGIETNICVGQTCKNYEDAMHYDWIETNICVGQTVLDLIANDSQVDLAAQHHQEMKLTTNLPFKE